MKYFICEGKLEEKNKYNASNKPREDVEKIAAANGYKKLYIESKYGVQTRKWKKPIQLYTYLKNRYIWERKLKQLNKGDIVFFQYPLLNTTLQFSNLLKKYNNKLLFVILIHDLDTLRWNQNIASQNILKRKKYEDKNIPNNCQFIIAHNDSMKEELIKMGNESKNIYTLNIFDYLTNNDFKGAEGDRDKPIIIAGSLDKNKAKYLSRLKEINDIEFNLYGGGYQEDPSSQNVYYKGKFLPEDLLNCLEGSFGLVWDGDSIDTCEGGFGNYLRYNNPHKVSMYLTSGIPIIVWKESAIAKFIEENNAGITINSLREIYDITKKISEKDYIIMKNNAKDISKRTSTGYYLTNVLEQINSIEK